MFEFDPDPCLEIVPDAAHFGGSLGGAVMEGGVAMGAQALNDTASLAPPPWGSIANVAIAAALPSAEAGAHEFGEDVGGPLGASVAFGACEAPSVFTFENGGLATFDQDVGDNSSDLTDQWDDSDWVDSTFNDSDMDLDAGGDSSGPTD